MISMEGLVQSFADSIYDTTLNIGEEMASAGIESILSDSILQSIPFGKVIFAIFHGAVSIHERNLLVQTMNFLEAYNSQTIDKERLSIYRKMLTEQPTKAEEELGRVIILLNRSIEKTKSRLLGHFFRSYIQGDISWEYFCELSEVTERMFVSDIQVLLDISKGTLKSTNSSNRHQANRLASLGLICMSPKTVFGEGRQDNYLCVSALGDSFIRSAFI